MVSRSRAWISKRRCVFKVCEVAAVALAADFELMDAVIELDRGGTGKVAASVRPLRHGGAKGSVT